MVQLRWPCVLPLQGRAEKSMEDCSHHGVPGLEEDKVIAGIQQWDLFGCYMYFCRLPHRKCFDRMRSAAEMVVVSPNIGDGH